MRKKLSIGLLLGAALAVSLYSCRSEDLLSNSEETPPSKFKVFTSVNGERVNYGEGFKILMEKHDSLNNEQHTAKAMKNAFENSKTVAEEYIEFNIRTEDQISDTGERWIVYPVISNSSVTGLVTGILNKEETTVEFRNLKPGNEYYDQLIPLFREQFQKSLISARQLNRNGKCGFPMQPPCEIDVIIITPPNSGGGIGIGIGGGGGEGTPKPCPKYADCIHNDPGGGGGGGSNGFFETPCQKIATIGRHADTKKLFEGLKGKTNSTKEFGEILKQNGGNINSTSVEGDSGDGGINFNISGEKVDGILHSHYGGLLSIFSPADLASLAVVYKANMINDSNTFILGLVTASGTQYILIIDNLAAFDTFAQQFLLPNGEINEGYIDLYGAINYNKYNIQNNGLATTNELGFTKLLSEKNTGLKILKGSDNSNTWSELKINNGKIVPKPCN